jgi:hypothetical protein
MPALNSVGFISYNFTATSIGSNVTLYSGYADNYSASDTSSLIYTIWYPNQTVYYQTTSGAISSIIQGYNVTNVAGTSYVWGIDAYSNQFGWFNQSSTISLHGVSGLSFDPLVYKGGW